MDECQLLRIPNQNSYIFPGWRKKIQWMSLFSTTFSTCMQEAHLWCVKPDELKDASLLQEYMKILSPCEKENVLSVKGEVLQKCALLSRVLVRTTLARYTDYRINPRSFKFKKNRFGKPEVEWQHNDVSFLPSLQFNVSHTSSLIACGITVNDPIGIDVEEKQRRPNADVLSLASRYFSPPEVQYLKSLVDSDSQKIEFIKLWTLKEAYVKALGRGFSGAPFRKFTIRFETRGDLVSEKLKTGEFRIAVEPVSDHETLTANWQFALAEITGSHFAAICMGIDENDTGKEHDLLKLKVWKTLPYMEDECLSDSEAVIKISGLS
ncbi:4'-phosphopantetheinyl transferase HetI-like isoform X2 [Zingiber officinale]|uniref:4'-phosphopantetheinyl transferase HetI-like isoform X2 n=2 Tax=Zingiber officinale TaxID=94328 RepID=UPI001C4B71B6|nr:4'-phosphopantetheinyl transferase HetI-like isoform X2 [Zingiber officinale]